MNKNDGKMYCETPFYTNIVCFSMFYQPLKLIREILNYMHRKFLKVLMMNKINEKIDYDSSFLH